MFTPALPGSTALLPRLPPCLSSPSLGTFPWPQVEVVVDTVYAGGLEDAEAAHATMESNANSGKLILSLVPATGGLD